jgi:deoxyribose-phosphate aldolase
MKEVMYKLQEIAAALDHAVLKPQATNADVTAACKVCIDRNIGGLCVRPTDVALAARLLRGSKTSLIVVVGFPHGSNLSRVKALEASLGIEDGAIEIDMVMNIGKFLSGDYNFVRSDIEAVVAVAKPYGAHVKVIQETCHLSLEQVAKACEICEAAGAQFVKTSTGFGPGVATPAVVSTMVATVGQTMGVKASGGIKDLAMATAYLNQGCTRLGTSSVEAILDEVEQ